MTRTTMRTLVLLFLLGVFVCGQTSGVFAQQGYTVALIVDDHWWQSTENWGVWLSAVVSHNGVPLPNSESYYYEWWVWFSHEPDWRILEAGYGDNEAAPETFPNWSLRIYVVVTDTAGAFSNIHTPGSDILRAGYWWFS